MILSFIVIECVTFCFDALSMGFDPEVD